MVRPKPDQPDRLRRPCHGYEVDLFAGLKVGITCGELLDMTVACAQVCTCTLMLVHEMYKFHGSID